MKRFFNILLCVLLVLTSFMAVSAEDKGVAVYSFGEIEGDVLPGEIISIPVYLTVTNHPIYMVLFKMQFDENSFEFQKYKKSLNFGDHELTMNISGITEADSSVVSEMFIASDGTTTASFDNTLLCTVSFKVKEGITDGNYIFDIVESQIRNDLMESSGYSEKETCTVTFGDVNADNSEDNEPEEGEEPDEETPDIIPDGEAPDEEGMPDDGEEENNQPPESTSDNKTEEDVKTEDKNEEITENVKTPEFSDLGGYDWAKDYIIPLAQQGVIRGTSETTFAPANNITRADFMVLLTRLLEINGKAEEGFDDVPADAYFANAVANGKKLGIAKGSDGKFNPYNSITREDMCVLVYRALVSMSYLPVLPDDDGFNDKFNDIDEISDYALTAMRDLSANGIIGGSDGKVNPKGFATRAETAVIMYRIQKLIPEF